MCFHQSNWRILFHTFLSPWDPILSEEDERWKEFFAGYCGGGAARWSALAVDGDDSRW